MSVCDARGRQTQSPLPAYVSAMHMHEFPVLMQEQRSLHDATQLFGRWEMLATVHTPRVDMWDHRAYGFRYIRYGSVRTLGCYG